MVDRVLLENGYDITNPKVVKSFQVILNGHRIDREYWTFTEVKEEDIILVAPIISRGDGGQLFKQAALIAIAVGAAAFGQAYISGWAWQAAFVATITIGGTLLLNGLIPPPAPPSFGGLGGEGSFEQSQMFSITGQSNAVKKFGFVPKVYGRHRIFPVIAANPYTEIQADPETGQNVQYFYAIYDFGFGPATISDIKIGDTPIQSFANCEYRLVDLNKPDTDEGIWDTALNKSFNFYKGDVERDGSVYALQKNKEDSGAFVDDYQVVRNASNNVQGSKQEIQIDFSFGQGLVAFGTDGSKNNRTVEVIVEFSKADEDVWKPFNDGAYVDDFYVCGVDNIYREQYITLYPFGSFAFHGVLFVSNYPSVRRGYSTGYYSSYSNVWITTESRAFYGILKGTTFLDILADASCPEVGQTLHFSGNFIGKVSSRIPAPGRPGYFRCNFEQPCPITFELFQIRGYRTLSGGNSFWTEVIDTSVSHTVSNAIIKKVFAAGVVGMTGKDTQPVYTTLKFTPKEIAAYKIRITRLRSYSSVSQTIVDAMTVTNISTRFDRNPITTDKRHVFLEVKIRATNQINGNITNLSAIANSVLDTWNSDTSQWEKQETSNPAWVFVDLLTGEINKKAISKSRLHLDSILEWAEFCDEVPPAPLASIPEFNDPRFSCNFVLDFNTTLQSLINSVTNAAQASLNLTDGKYGVLIDKRRTIPVQIFTPRNSTNFSSRRAYADDTHALKINYVDPNTNWQLSETLVYADGYNAEGTDGKLEATEFDELTTFACTSAEQSWRWGRYMLAQAKLRKETISITVDFEYLVCARGDFVQITNDVMKTGGRPARVKEITGANTIKIDDAFTLVGGVDYGYVYRGVNGIKTNSLDVIDSDEFRLYGEMPQVGDLIIVGEVGKIVMDCIVKSIDPADLMSATLVLVEKADPIYDAESTDSTPIYNPQISTVADPELAIPNAISNLAVVNNTWKISGGTYQYYIDLSWDVPVGGGSYETFEVYVDSGTGYSLENFTKENKYRYIVKLDNLGFTHKFKILAVSAAGRKLPMIAVPEVSAIPERKNTAPSTVSALFLNITNEVLQLDWFAVSDQDLKEYLIRYSPRTDSSASWEASTQLLAVSSTTTMASTQARTGTYFIKAADLNGNVSIDSAMAITTIPNLFNLNVISETNDFPGLQGELVATENDGQGIKLQSLVVGGVATNQYYSEGYYYYHTLLDLGEIYTVRLQSLIEAEGYSVADIMSSWAKMSDVTSISTAGNADWDVETHYRTTDKFNVMSEWSAMTDVDPISEGDVDIWTPWKKFTIGDFTGRIFLFRLKLNSYNPSVTPRVFNGIIRADMPDRTESYTNFTAVGAAGCTVTYSPAFMGPGTSPNIQITQDNAQPGDYYSIDNRTLNGFRIRFYNSGVEVTRQFDAVVKGYGRQALTVI